MEPIGFEPNWADHPSRFKTYLGVTRLPLPAAPTAGLPPVGRLLGAAPPRERYTLERLATMLGLSYGVLNRRLRVTWNQDSLDRTRYPQSNWGRGTASGGGMYPL